ncbi:MAG TPA: type IV pilin-like G/H family protein [Coleofasciculaceae cyanobacterium]
MFFNKFRTVLPIERSDKQHLIMKTDYLLQERYQLQEKLGQNAGRQTWLATDIQAASPVVVKLLAFNPQLEWDDLKLFEREVQVLRTINHYRIPKYYNSFTLDDLEGSGFLWFGLVQEYIPGDSLQQLLNQGKCFTEKQVLDIATQILQILIDLHELSPPIIHRDIKPSNLILGKDNQIYLVDFGAVQDKAKIEGATFTVVGTSGYVPPEQLWGKAVAASDLYALGATLIYLLTGIPPSELFQGQMRIQFKDLVNISSDFVNWLEQLIQPAPEQRFSTARQALSALQTPHSPSPEQGIISKPTPNSANYFSGFMFLVLIVLGMGGISIIIRLSCDSTHNVRQAEAKNTIGAMTRAQQAYFLEYSKLTDDIDKLGIGIKTKTDNYTYSIRKTEKAVVNYGISRKKEIKSFVGGVFVVPGTTLDPHIDDETRTLTIICEALRPGIIKPPEPTYQNGKLTCGKGTRDLSDRK